MDKRTCSEPECEGLHLAKGFCRKHYRAHGLDSNRGKKLLRTADCKWCGHSFSRYASNPKRMNSCSDECARMLIALSSSKVLACNVHFPECPACGIVFTAQTSSARFCTEQCKRRQAYNSYKNKRNAVMRESYTPKPLSSLMCQACGIAFLSKAGTPRCAACAAVRNLEVKADGSRRRRARKRGVEHETVRTAYIYERDAWQCGVCGKAVKKSLRYPHPMSASLDHIIPLAHGGKHTNVNTQLAHLTCNVVKSDSLTAQPRLFG